MNNIKKALTALAATAVLAPTLVACGQRNLISVNHEMMGNVLVDCAAGKVSLPDGRVKGFYTPENLGKEAVRVATKENNPFAALGGAMVVGAAQNAIDTACAPDVKLTEPNEDGVRSIAPKVATVIPQGQAGTYQDGLAVTVKGVNAYNWIKAANMFADKVVAGKGRAILVVNIAVRNAGNKATSLMGREFTVVDKAGNVYTPLTDMGTTMWLSEAKGNQTYDFTDIQPGTQVTRTFVFNVEYTGPGGLRLMDRSEYEYRFHVGA